MYINRLLEKSLQEALLSFPAVFIGGPRRSGKTTLVKRLGAGCRYVLLDELDIRTFASDDPKGFLDAYPPPVIIDEIQNVPQLLSYIKARIDKDDQQRGQWILTGSQQWALMKNIGETLAGRIAILHLYPFAITEIQQITANQPESANMLIEYFKNATNIPRKMVAPGDWLLEGGYPEIVLGRKASRKLWFSSYIQTYLDRDIRGNVKEINLRDFERFVRLLASRTAQQLNASTLAADVGVSVPTIKSWLTLLEASGLIFFLMPYYKNFGKRIIKAPKCYFMDTGLVCYLVGIQDDDFALQGPMGGALFETACVSQIYKRLAAMGEERTLYYYRSSDGLEIDLLIERPEYCYPFEIKLSSTINPQHTRNISKWLEISQAEKRIGFVISTAKELTPVASGIQNIHYALL